MSLVSPVSISTITYSFCKPRQGLELGAGVSVMGELVNTPRQGLGLGLGLGVQLESGLVPYSQLLPTHSQSHDSVSGGQLLPTLIRDRPN